MKNLQISASMGRSSRVAKNCIERVKLAVKRNGFPSQQALADEIGMSRDTIRKFLNGIPVEHLNFVEISEKLGLDWQKIVHIEHIEDELLTEVFPNSPPNAESAQKSELAEIGEVKVDIHQLLQLAQQIGEASQPTVSSANLISEPPTLEKWLGRKREIQQLQVWLNDADIKTIGIQGLSGVGKSWLASYIYEQKATTSQFSNKFWADVSQLPDFTVFAQNSLLKLGEKSLDELKDLREPNQLIHQLLKCLKTRPCLLVIDNLETLLDRDRCFIGAYRDFFRFWQERGTSISKLLLTTQTQPTLMDGLLNCLNLSGLEKSDGAQLLRELNIQGTEAELKDFVELVGGHPKILRLVASQLTRCKKNPHILEVEKLGLREISIALHKIKMPYRDQERVLFVSILEEHFNNLTPELQRFLMNLSIYRRRAFNWEAAAVVLGEGEASAEYLETIEALEELKGRSLLDEVEMGGERKFQFHPFVWQYAKQKAGEQPEALREKVIAYYQSMTTDESSWKTLEDVAPYIEIFYHKYEQKEYANAFDIISISDQFLQVKGYNNLRGELYIQLLSDYRSNDIRDQERVAESYLRLGRSYSYQGQYRKAIEHYRQSLEIALGVNAFRIQAQALSGIANAYYYLREYNESLQVSQQCLEIVQQISYQEGKANVLIDIAHNYHAIRNYERAINYAQNALKISKNINNSCLEATALSTLGVIYLSLKNYKNAIFFFHQSLEILDKLGDYSLKTITLSNLGGAYYYLEQNNKAIECYQESLEIAKRIGDAYRESIALKWLAQIYRRLKQYHNAINCYHRQLEITRELDEREWEAHCLFNLGITLSKIGEKTQALDAYHKALALYEMRGLHTHYQNTVNAIQSLTIS